MDFNALVILIQTRRQWPKVDDARLASPTVVMVRPVVMRVTAAPQSAGRTPNLYRCADEFGELNANPAQ